MQTNNKIALLSAGLTAVAAIGGVLFTSSSATAQDNGRQYNRNGQNGQYNQNDRYNRNNLNNRQNDATSWSNLSGRPSIRAGRESGFFIWRSGNTVHVNTTDTNTGNNFYRGEITIDGGHFNNVGRDGKSQSNSDKVERPEQTRIKFEFNTQRDTDGLHFDVVDGDRITFRLNRDGRDGDRVYVGPSKQQVSGSSFTIDLNDNNNRGGNGGYRNGGYRNGNNGGYRNGGYR